MQRFYVYEKELSKEEYERVCEAIYHTDRSMCSIKAVGQSPWYHDGMNGTRLNITFLVKDFNGIIGEVLQKNGFKLRGERAMET